MKTSSILIVEDEVLMQDYYVAVLGESYHCRCANSGEQCLQSLEEGGLPDLILLDVSMNGIDGYETCRQIRSAYGHLTPVIFISARDQLEDKLLGYEAGGNDYVVKPVEIEELISKIQAQLTAAQQQKSLQTAVHEAGATAMTAMTAMAEMGAVLASIKDISQAPSFQAVADRLLNGIAQFGLQGVVWVKSVGQEVAVSTHGHPNPIEVSAVKLVAEMGRLVEFKSRLSISYEAATILVNNFPTADSERCGRLRDHLMMMVEMAYDRVKVLEREVRFKSASASAIQVLTEVDRIQRNCQMAGNIALEDMTRDFERAYVQVALTEEQEHYMASIMQTGFDRVRASILAGFEAQSRFTSVVTQLKEISQAGGAE